ncbi:unnamed protein product [Caenorhabditis bovis]|uniref:Uncharacterized protein n=1 Tax=Caenorhabditis bovis TaxID=2654633 RepID=A0A8S1FF58_9PELO|nr:unnamed protein product [Caenorhabditis bovis]
MAARIELARRYGPHPNFDAFLEYFNTQIRLLREFHDEYKNTPEEEKNYPALKEKLVMCRVEIDHMEIGLANCTEHMIYE